MFLLDTNACIRILNGSCDRLIKNMLDQSPADIRLCAISKAELLYGARHSANAAANLRLLERFFAPLLSLPFDDGCAEICGRIRAELASSGKPIGSYDLQIAATALANNLTLVTHNTREFSRVAGLRLIDWES